MPHPFLRISVLFTAALLVAASAARAGGAGAAAGKRAATQPLRLGTVSGEIPASWTSQTPGGQFRMAQYAIPKATGDTAPALFIVFHFGKNGGGTVEENIRRWSGMMRQPEGGDAPKPKQDRITREGLRITTLDLSGTYLERPFPAAEQVTERPNYRMLAAIVETTAESGDGPYYLRLVGPAKSVGAAKAGWDALIASLQAS